MRRRRYLIGTSYLLWKTDEGGRDVADVIAMSSGPSPPRVVQGSASENWELVN